MSVRGPVPVVLGLVLAIQRAGSSVQAVSVRDPVLIVWNLVWAVQRAGSSVQAVSVRDPVLGWDPESVSRLIVLGLIRAIPLAGGGVQVFRLPLGCVPPRGLRAGGGSILWLVVLGLIRAIPPAGSGIQVFRLPPGCVPLQGLRAGWGSLIRLVVSVVVLGPSIFVSAGSLAGSCVQAECDLRYLCEIPAVVTVWCFGP